MQYANLEKFFIGGRWQAPCDPRWLDIVDPATEQVFARVPLGNAADLDCAVAAAKTAFTSYGFSNKQERLALLRAILAAYLVRAEDLAEAMTREMGAPRDFSRAAQVEAGRMHLEEMLRALEHFHFDTMRNGMLLTYEPVGIAGLVTPWNWPMNQIVSKVAAALAAGCTCVLKPSEVAPLSATIFAEIVQAAGAPPGVFNLVQGDGAGVGSALAAHEAVDVVSFTGSNAGGVAVAHGAAETVKRVLQELGGKSPNLILPGADLAAAVRHGVAACFANAGQSCDAPTRMLVPRGAEAEAAAIAQAAAMAMRTGHPGDPRTELGPLANARQWDRVQAFIASGLAEGAVLVTGGLGRPEDLPRGYYVRPTVFAGVTPAMRIAREEIFGPVLCILPYDDVEQALSIANDSPYGLSARVHAADLELARGVARRLRAGNVLINEAEWIPAAPFGGYKRSGNGREGGLHGMLDFLEVKAVLGYAAEAERADA